MYIINGDLIDQLLALISNIKTYHSSAVNYSILDNYDSIKNLIVDYDLLKYKGGKLFYASGVDAIQIEFESEGKYLEFEYNYLTDELCVLLELTKNGKQRGSIKRNIKKDNIAHYLDLYFHKGRKSKLNRIIQ